MFSASELGRLKKDFAEVESESPKSKELLKILNERKCPT